MEKAIKAAYNRHSDQKYYLTKILKRFCYLKKSNYPEFTDEDNKFKLELFGIPDLDTCFITGTPCKGVGIIYMKLIIIIKKQECEVLMMNGIRYRCVVN